MQSFPRALLEEWMRLYSFAVDADIGSSGVSDYSLTELRALLGIGVEEMDAVVFHDSQTLGGPGVRRAVARRWAGGDVDGGMVTHGSTEAIFPALNALLRPGDEVAVLDPVYPGLGDVVRAIGCRLVPWTLRPEDGWRPDVDALEEAASPRTRMIVVNFPHNPTGATLHRRRAARAPGGGRASGRLAAVGRRLRRPHLRHAPLPDPRCATIGRSRWAPSPRPTGFPGCGWGGAWPRRRCWSG